MRIFKFHFIAALAFAFLFSFDIHAQQIEIKVSRLHGLLIFAFSNANFPHYSPFLKETVDNSKYKDQVATILADISNLEKSLQQGVNYREKSDGYGDGFIVQDLVEIQSAHAKDIDDLINRLQITMPIEDLQKLGKILKQLDPIYDELIWLQTKSDIEAIEKTFNQKIKEWKINSLFQKAKVFYRSKWPDDLKFTMALYPIPKGAHHSNAHSLSAFESVGVIIGEKDLVGRFGVMFHEMMHSIYDAQEIKFRRELISWFQIDQKDSDAAYRFGAQKFSNEIFATILGNGWAYESISGEQDKTSWYSEPHIEGMSHALYDLTKTYLNEGKSIDQEYVKSMGIKFKELFTDYPNTGDYLFADLGIYHTDQVFKVPEIRSAIRSQYRNINLGITSNSDMLKSFKPRNEKTKMILLSKEEASKLTSKQIGTLSIHVKLFKQLKKKVSGLWRWKEKNGNTRILAIADVGELKQLFSGKIESVEAQ